MVLGHVLERVARHRAHARAVDPDVGDLVAPVRGDDEGLVGARNNTHYTRWVNLTALVS